MLSKRLLVGFFIALSFISIQSVFKPLRSIPLAGAEFIPEAKSLSLENWMSLDWQNNLEARTKKTFGFRPSFVRIYNQLLYSIFDEYNPQIQAFGDTLFERAYVNSIEGADFLGQAEIQAKVDSLSAFRNMLKASGKQLIILIAPNKWRTFQKAVPADKTNYSEFSHALKKRDFHVVDALEYFVNTSDSSAYPLHSKEGTHWSIYGAYKASLILKDSLERIGITLPKTTLDSFEIANPRNTDKDLHDLLNILMLPIKQDLAYPKLSFGEKEKVKALVIGDSYYWTFYYLGLHQHWFDSESPFFYYNKGFVLNDVNSKLPILNEFRQASLDRAELVIFVMSEPSLKWFGFGILSENIQ